MTGFSDRTVIVKIGDGEVSETFTAIAALRDVTISETNAAVDITNKDSAGNRTLLDAKSKYSMTVTGTGVFTDNQTIADVKALARSGALNNFQIDEVSAGATTAGEVLDGAFKVTQFERAAPNEGEVNYTLTLESSGAIAAT